MNARRALVRAYPRGWRETFGPEFLALLEDRPLTPGTVLDVVRAAAVERARYHRRGLVVLAAVAAFAGSQWWAAVNGVTDNILWMPSTPRRAVALVQTLAPLVALGCLRRTGWWRSARRRRPVDGA